MKYDSISEAYFDFHKKTLRSEVDFMLKYDINYQQMLYIKLLFFEQIETLYKYIDFNFNKKSKPKERFKVSDINDLYDKNIVKNKWIKSINTTPDINDLTDSILPEVSQALQITPEFLNKKREKEIEKNKLIDLMGEELFDAYPSTNDSGMLLVACNSFSYKGSTYEGKEDVKRLYAELIDFDWKTHKEVMSKIKSDKGEVCNVKITTFVKNKLWEHIKETTWYDEV